MKSDDTVHIQSLLDRAGGEPAVYDELIAATMDRLAHLARRMLNNYPHLRRWEQTADVLQNAAFRLHRSLKEVVPQTPREFFGLAALQTRRTLIELARHHFGPHGGARHHHSDADAFHARHAAATDSDSVKPQTLDAWVSFHQAIESLPPNEQEVFELTWYGGLSRNAVAEVLGLSVSTVQRRWQAARIAVHDALQGDPPPV